MTAQATERLDALVSGLLEAGDEIPMVSATMDLSVGGSGQPPALKVLDQAVRHAIEEADLPEDYHQAVHDEAKRLEAAAIEASEGGALGLIYFGSAEVGVRAVALDTPIRTSLHTGARPWLFELALARYLARPVCLVQCDLHTMDVVRVQYGAVQAEDKVDWDEHFLTEKGQRTGRDAQGGAPGTSGSGGSGPAGASGRSGPGHSYVVQRRHVDEQRNLFANQAAEHLEEFVRPGDLLVVEGVDEARQQLLARLPERLQQIAVQQPAVDPTEQERDRLARLREYVHRAQLDLATLEANRWFAGAHADLAFGGPQAITTAAEQGRVATIILHPQSETHFGTSEDARLQETSADPGAVEAALQAALRQGAEVAFSDDPRILEQQGGAIAIGRF